MSNDLPPSKVCLTNLDPVFDILVNGHKGYDWHWLKWLFPLINMIILFTAINILGKHLWCFINSITKIIPTPQVRKHLSFHQFNYQNDSQSPKLDARTRMRRVRDLQAPQAPPQVKSSFLPRRHFSNKNSCSREGEGKANKIFWGKGLLRIEKREM